MMYIALFRDENCCNFDDYGNALSQQSCLWDVLHALKGLYAYKIIALYAHMIIAL